MRWCCCRLSKRCLVLSVVVTVILCLLELQRKWNSKIQVLGKFSAPKRFDSLPRSEDLRYKIWYNVWTPFSTNSLEKDISIITQTSANNFHYLLRTARYWDGLISVAVFAPGNDFQVFMQQLDEVTHCHHFLSSKLIIHLVFPLSHPPAHQILDVRLKSKFTCNSNGNIKRTTLKNYAAQAPYPVNLLRNVAVKGVSTSHVFVIDVDMVPSKKLKNQLINSDILDQDLKALVIPAFEVKSSTYLPLNKAELIKFWNNGFIRPFYEKVCWKCQKYTDYQHWRSTNPDSETYLVDWHDPWEPFYIAKKNDVLYDERFEQYGFNRISQLCQIHMQGFAFHVFQQGFLLHIGFKEVNAFHSNKNEENKRNKVLYRKIKAELIQKSKDSNRHC